LTSAGCSYWVDRAAVVEVDDRLEVEVGAAGEREERLEQHRAELLHPDDDALRPTAEQALHDLLRDVGVQHDARSRQRGRSEPSAAASSAP
jgi:hypothetical protein